MREAERRTATSQLSSQTTPRKKLIEVALPLAKINEAAAREKSIRHGHPSTLHLWWARRPLAACRAVLFASLVDDPDSDPHYRLPDGTVLEAAAGKRSDLFSLIEELVQWENSNNENVIRSARAEIARCVASRLIETGKLAGNAALGQGITAQDLVERCHCRPQFMGIDKKLDRSRYHFDVDRLPPGEVVNAFLAEHAPPVLDPFCGGGSIPLEAQRLGLRAYASDLNPVAVLITKALIEIPPKFAGRPPVNPEWQKKSAREKAAKVWTGAQGLAADVRYYGQWMRDEAEKRIGHLYPKVKITKEMAKDQPDLKEYVGEEVTVLAWLWARTVATPEPSCSGAHVPIVKSFCLSKRSGENVWIEPKVERATNTYRFRIKASDSKPGFPGTVNRQGVKCLLSGTRIPLQYVRNEGKAGRLGIRQLAIIAEAKGGRIYLSPLLQQVELKVNAESAIQSGPDTEMANNPFSLRPPLYGFRRFADLFRTRQLAALDTFCTLVREMRKEVLSKNKEEAYADALSTYLAFVISKCSDYWNSIARWMPRGTVGNAFSRQAIPMTWDFPEANPFADFHCSWIEAVDWVAKVVENALSDVIAGTVIQGDATVLTETAGKAIISTDPPYYNNIDYADLSDFFYVWLRRSLGKLYPLLFTTIGTPKSPELVASPYRFDGDADAAKVFFEEGLSRSFSRMQNRQIEEYPLTVFYAFKLAESDEGLAADLEGENDLLTSTGWETMLDALIKSGFVIDGTWPIRTERPARTMSISMNALASSVVLVCRPRPTDAPLATRKQLITALRQELPEALRSLQQGNIAPVDLAQAAIGPGMAVLTRFTKVMETDGSAMTVRTALGLINQALDEVLAEQEGEFDGDTRWALAWFEQFGMDEGPFGVAETLSKAKNTAVNGLVEAGVVKARGGKVRLVKRAELPDDWDPAQAGRLTVWEATQHLIRTLDQQGESGAAALLHKLGGVAETARDLAYRLYTLCERKKWAEEALAYNGLVIAWPELTKLALAERGRDTVTQKALDF